MFVPLSLRVSLVLALLMPLSSMANGDEVSSLHSVAEIAGRSGVKRHMRLALDRKVSANATHEVSDMQAQDDCCSCPAMPVQGILDATRAVREALDRAVKEHNDGITDPQKHAWWFVDSGTLIAALRYGAHAHMYQSGKLNLADGDIDVTVACQFADRPKLMGRIQEFLREQSSSGEQAQAWRVVEVKPGPRHIIYSPVKIPNGCSDSTAFQNFHVDVHRLDITEAGVDPIAEYNLWSGMYRKDSPNKFLDTSIFLPLVRGQWGGGEGAFIPRDYMRVLLNYNNGEFPPPLTPQTNHFATGASFECPCEMTKDDNQEMMNTIKNLQTRKLAYMHDVPANQKPWLMCWLLLALPLLLLSGWCWSQREKPSSISSSLGW